MRFFVHPKSRVGHKLALNLEFWLEVQAGQRYSWVLPRCSDNSSISRLISKTSIAITNRYSMLKGTLLILAGIWEQATVNI